MVARSCLAAIMSATEMLEKTDVLNCCMEMASAMDGGIFALTFSDLKINNSEAALLKS